MHRNNFHRAVSILLDTEFTTKFHSDPSFVSDVDALEDCEDFEALTHYAEAQFGEEGLAHIHPFGEELIRFREERMPDLKNHISMYKNFPTYVNLVYRSLKMQHVPFPNGKQYMPVSPNLKKEQYAQKTEHAFSWYSKKCGVLKVKNARATRTAS